MIECFFSRVQINSMYLKRNKKMSCGVSYDYWTLVESVRTASGPRQRVVANVGKLFGREDEEKIGWERIGEILSGKKKDRTQDMFEPVETEPPDWAIVDVNSVRVERMRRFGDVFLGLCVWRRLGLDDMFDDLCEDGREEYKLSLLACVLAIGRLCEQSSELELAQSWYAKTALDELLGIPAEKINKDRLYRALDRMLPFKDEVCRRLQERYAEWFGASFDFLMYDVTSVYFEGVAEGNEQARRGYSRDHRPDCPQVCIGLVVTREGLPVGYEVFDGNRADVTTLDNMLELMERKYGRPNRVWVFDRGIASEENICKLRERGAMYLVGTPKPMLKKFESELLDKNWKEIRPGLEVKALPSPEGGNETFILCRSQDRKEKEKAMLEKAVERLERRLESLAKSVREGKLKDRATAERRIGRWLGRFTRAESLFEVRLLPENGPINDVCIIRKEHKERYAELSHGAYLLRTNLNGHEPEELWKIYMQLNQAESSFRICKSDLGIRPVYHQKSERVRAHIFVCFLALALWRSLEMWMDSKGLGTCARKLINEMKEVRSMDVLLDVKDRNPARLRIVGRPEKHLSELLDTLGVKLPNRPKNIKM